MQTTKPIILHNQYNVVFSANTKHYAATWLKTAALCFLTCGVYYFWYLAARRAFLCHHTQFLAVRFRYNDNGSKAALASLTAVVSALLILALAELSFYLTKSWQVPAACVFFCGLPWLGYVKITRWCFFWKHTTWGKKPIHVTTKPITFVLWFSLGTLASIASCGMLYPFIANKLFALRYGALSCGELKLSYSGHSRDVYEDYISHLPSIIVTCGLTYPVLQAKLWRYRIAHLWLGGDSVGSTRGCSAMSAKNYYELLVKNSILVLVTAGLAYPWLMMAKLHYWWGRFAFIGFLDFSELVSSEDVHAAIQDDGVGVLKSRPQQYAVVN